MPASRPAGGDHLAGVDAGPDLKPGPVLRLELPIQGCNRVAHLDCGANCANGVILMGKRDSEHRHHRVADVLLDGAAMSLQRR